jgi:hypothetical protein
MTDEIITDDAGVPLTGRAYNEAIAGYVPLPEPEKPNDLPEFADAKEAAAFRSAQREPTTEVEELALRDTETYEIKPDNVTLKLEQAADLLSDYRGAVADQRAASISADFGAAIDKMRADAIKNAPDPAAEVEKLGLERSDVDGVVDAITDEDPKPVKEVKETKEAKTDWSVVESPSVDGLDPEVERALKHPQVAQAIESEWSKADATRQEYAGAIEAAQRISQLAIVDALPELANVPIQNWESALQVLHSQNPQRVQQAMGLIQRAGQLHAAQQQQEQQRAAVERQQIETWARAEDAKLESSMGVKFDRQSVDEVTAYAKTLGIEAVALREAMLAHPILRSAQVQKMMFDAAKYHAARTNSPKAAPKSLPPVQRPGVSNASPRNDSSVAKIQNLESRLEKATGNQAIKLAAELTRARRAAK